jgi:hypothetical protein
MMTSLLIKLDSEVPESPLGAKVSLELHTVLLLYQENVVVCSSPKLPAIGWQLYPWIPVLARFSSYG